MREALAHFHPGEPTRAVAHGEALAAKTRSGRTAELRVFPPASAERLAAWRTAMAGRAALRQAALPQIHEFGVAGDRAWVLAAPPAGVTLTEHRAGKTLPPTPALALAHRLLRALELLHGAGIAHGALAAGTVFVAPDGRVALADAGVVAPLGLADPDHAAPELFADPAAASARADLYAAGLIFHELLTGHRPARVAAGESAPPAAPGAVALPPYLGMVIARMLARPERRLATAAEAIELLVPPAARTGWGEHGAFANPLAVLKGRGRTSAVAVLVVLIALVAVLALVR